MNCNYIWIPSDDGQFYHLLIHNNIVADIYDHGAECLVRIDIPSQTHVDIYKPKYNLERIKSEVSDICLEMHQCYLKGGPI
jgi:hypothetical protein